MKPRSATRRFLPSSPFNAEPEPVIEEFAVGDRVTHDKHGLGRVVGREENAVTVEFAGQHVRVPSPYTKLTKL